MLIASALFASTLLIGYLITENFTDYGKWSPEEKKIKDLVTAFYNIWNPCILFDHYPSNIITLFLIALFIIINTVFLRPSLNPSIDKRSTI